MSSAAFVCIDSGGHQKRVFARRDALAVEHISLVPPIARRIHATLPPSFDLEELIAVGNFALVRAATRYRPRQHDGTPFKAFAKASIEGAIHDTFRRNKLQEQTRPGLDDLAKIPIAIPKFEERIDLARRFASLRNQITVCLSPIQAAIFDEYYSPSMPELSEVARALGITRGQAERGHACGMKVLRERMKTAA